MASRVGRSLPRRANRHLPDRWSVRDDLERDVPRRRMAGGPADLQRLRERAGLLDDARLPRRVHDAEREDARKAIVVRRDADAVASDVQSDGVDALREFRRPSVRPRLAERP